MQEALSKSLEISLDEGLESTLSSSCPASHHEVRRKSFKQWFSHKIKKRSKSEMQSGSSRHHSERNVHRIDSYTKRVSHITEKYEKISKEKKMKDALEAAARKKEQPLSPDSPHSLHIPSGVEEFTSLPLYSQLKYKLSIILSNIHIPTPPHPPLQQLSLPPNTVTAKKDLVALLEGSLYRNLWIADSSEGGVIRELLCRINELDEDWYVV